MRKKKKIRIAVDDVWDIIVTRWLTEYVIYNAYVEQFVSVPTEKWMIVYTKNENVKKIRIL